MKDGLYAANFGGGQVDITSGKFVFSAAEAWKIEDGKLAYPVKGATLIGNGPDALTRVSMIGNDLELDAGVGTCGKDGQSVPVGVGQPTLKIDGLTVGGRVATRSVEVAPRSGRESKRSRLPVGSPQAQPARATHGADHPPARRRAHEDVGADRRAARGAVVPSVTCSIALCIASPTVSITTIWSRRNDKSRVAREELLPAGAHRVVADHARAAGMHADDVLVVGPGRHHRVDVARLERLVERERGILRRRVDRRGAGLGHGVSSSGKRTAKSGIGDGLAVAGLGEQDHAARDCRRRAARDRACI